ncbi:MAG: Rrf2 family transcriptional regulator [Gammaproteobacteria bacterium]|nr:Rrf2 family transcriptional regulator [Gammaproteobacteria bacterium]
MQLTLYTDISLRVLLHLAKEQSDIPFTIGYLAELFAVSRNHMVKIVNKLGKGGYLNNVRGKGGGIYLGRPAEEINIAEVVLLMENNTEVVNCEKNRCHFIGNCKLKTILNQATDAFFSHLRQHTLADLISNETNVNVPSF